MRNASMLIAGTLAFALSACHDLEVTNPNNPDRDVVVGSPTDVEALVATSFRRWFNLTQGNTPSWALSVEADEFTGGFFDFGTQLHGLEPRNAVNNDPNAAGTAAPHRPPISTLYSIISAVNIALQAIQDRGLRITEGGTDVTPRAQAFAKFVQGLSHSYAAAVYDRSWLFSEDIDTEAIAAGGGSEVVDLIRPYPEVRDLALGQLEDALAIARQNSFVLPGGTAGDWIPGPNLTNQDLARIIHSYIARTLVYTARSPQERAQVDWARVIDHIDQGVTTDFAPSATPDILESFFKQRTSRQRTTIPGDFARPDYQLIGPADQSDRFRSWANTAWANRQPFIMVDVRDRRIISAPDAPCDASQNTALANEGTYMGCHINNVWADDRGTGTRSYYYYHRMGRLTSWQNGPQIILSRTEMDLLKAEGLVRLGRAAEAVPLINATRVENGGLPPVTLEGVPMVDGNCTPRKLSGECGSLWDALRYEKRIEGTGVDAMVAKADARGWQALVVNTPIHWPMPGNELILMGVPNYTLGGGEADSAPQPNPEACPVALPRCP